MLRRLRGERDEIAGRLRAEAEAARIEPPARVRSRALAAMECVSRDGPQREPHGRLGASVAACGAAAILAVIPLVSRPKPAAPGPPVASITLDRSRFEGFFEIDRRLGAIPSPWETLLGEEAQLLAADARAAGEQLLASLPIPSIRLQR